MGCPSKSVWCVVAGEARGVPRVGNRGSNWTREQLAFGLQLRTAQELELEHDRSPVIRGLAWCRVLSPLHPLTNTS